MLVYLADLTHKSITVNMDGIPLGIGFLATYGSKVLGPEVRFKLFGDAELLMTELRHTKPDVMGVTNYCWNYALHCRVLRYARDLYPDVLTVMGGPNISTYPKRQEALLRDTPGLDLYIIDEGEVAFAHLLRRVLDCQMASREILREALPSAIFIDPDSDRLVRGLPTARISTLDDIPSPYLTGMMDSFFEEEYCPVLQTARGCPFTCTFCVEGGNYLTKVNKFDPARVRAELDYMSRRASAGSGLILTDSNFGMIPGNLDTAQAIRQLQDETGWPKIVLATTGKNNKEGVLSAIEVLNGTMTMSNSVQSMDPVVLKNIKRANIKLDTYVAIQDELIARNLQSYAEVISALPGETKESFFQGVESLLDSGTQQISVHQLMLLEGTELCDDSSREIHGFRTKIRLLSRSFGTYADEPVFETEEIVVATNTLSFDDYLEIRKLQLVLEVYHRNELFRELLECLKLRQIPVSEFMFDLYNSIPDAPQEIKDLFAAYLQEAQDELFDSAEDLRRAYTLNYDLLLQEEAGGNLVQKYSAVAWFQALEVVLEYGIQRARNLVLKSVGQDPHAASAAELELQAIHRYLLANTINLVDLADQSEDAMLSLPYNIEAWKEGQYRQSLSDFQHPSAGDGAGEEGYLHRFYIPQEHAAYLRDAVSIHGKSSQALGKMMSRVAVRDLRRNVEVMQPDALESGVLSG